MNLEEFACADLTLIIDDQGYVNATNLCANADVQPSSWFEFTGLKFIAALKVCENVIPIKVRDDETYLHPELVPHLAAWISPLHAIKANKIIQQYALRLLQCNNDSLRDKLGRRDTKIVRLKQEREDLRDELDRLDLRLLQAQDELARMKQQIPMDEPHYVGLYRLNSFSPYEYTFYWRKGSGAPQAHRDIMKQHPAAVKIRDLPATRSHSREHVKSILQRLGVTFHGNSNEFKLPLGTSAVTFEADFCGRV